MFHRGKTAERIAAEAFDAADADKSGTISLAEMMVRCVALRLIAVFASRLGSARRSSRTIEYCAHTRAKCTLSRYVFVFVFFVSVSRSNRSFCADAARFVARKSVVLFVCLCVYVVCVNERFEIERRFVGNVFV